MVMEPAHKEKLKHMGYKGGSTSWVLTWATYAEQLDGQKIECVFMLNDLSPKTNTDLQAHLADFNTKILNDQAFRNNFINMIKQKK